MKESVGLGVSAVFSVLFASILFVLPAQAEDSIPLTGTFSKIYRPDLSSPKSCTYGSFAISRTDGRAFQNGEILEVSVYAYYPEDKKRSSSPVTYAFPEISSGFESGKLEATSGARYQLCADAWQNSNFRKNFASLFFDVRYKMNYGSTLAGRLTSVVTILPKDAEANTIEKVLRDCTFDFFEDNAVLEVSPEIVKTGTMATVTGTYFIKGVPAPNQALNLSERIVYSSGASKIIELGSATTNSEGIFSFKFKFVQRDDHPMPFFQITRSMRTAQIGFLHGPFEPTSNSFSFMCDKGKCKYTPGGTYTDFIPEFSTTCLATFKEYDDIYGVGAGTGVGLAVNFTDDKNRIAWLGRKVFKGSKNKVQFTATWISKETDFPQRDTRNLGKAGGKGPSVGKKCYVNGYTTKAGKRVSGYYRSC